MTGYYRPLVSCDAVRPNDAVSLAGGWAWFSQAEHLTRDGSLGLIAAEDIPAEQLVAFTAPRAGLADVGMDKPRLMGILNVTPDSFSDGGLFANADTAKVWGASLVADGADFLDIGGESTRPGAEPVSEAAEIERTAPVIAALAANVAAPISIDTRNAPVARAALAAGALMLNDVSALSHDLNMALVAEQSDTPICLMHAQGDPKTMQADPRYDNILLDIYDYLAGRIKVAQAAGISRDRIIVDPGIGFGKTAVHNLALLRGLSLFHGLGCPILLGASRKRFIGTIGNAPDPQGRMPGSIAVALGAIAQGVQIVRVHDIKETKQALSLWQAVTGMKG